MFGAPGKWSDATISVLICDDAALSRRQLTVALEASDHIEVVAEAADPETALAEAVESTPDVIWMGLPLDSAGVRLISSMLERVPTARVVVVCGPEDAEARVRALRAGAFGFARRDETIADALAITEGVAWGHTWLDGRDLTALRDAFDGLARQVGSVQQQVDPPRLDEPTRQVLDALADGRTAAEAAAATGLSVAAVDGAVASSLVRLHRHTRSESLVHGQGTDPVGLG